MYPDDRPCFIARSAVLKKKDIGGLLTKTVDLKSAYKQFAIAPADRKRAVITRAEISSLWDS